MDRDNQTPEPELDQKDQLETQPEPEVKPIEPEVRPEPIDQTSEADPALAPESTEPTVEPDSATLTELDDQDLKISEPKWYKNKRIVGLLLGLILLIGLIVGYLVFFQDSSQEDNTPSDQTEEQVSQLYEAQFSLVEGKVDYSDNQGTLWKTASQQSEIKQGYWLRVADDPDSRAVVDLSDGSELRLSSSTQVEVKDLSQDSIEIELIKGDTYSRVAKNADRQYVVSTKNLRAEALGTAYRTQIKDQQEVVEVYQGNVDESTTDNQLKEGKALSYSREDQTSNVDDLQIENLKQDPFITWNRSLDEKDESYSKNLGFLSDIESPDLSITSPNSGTEVKIAEGANTASIDIEGKTEPNLVVNVTASNGDQQVVNADAQGSFKLRVSSGEAEVLYTVSTQDGAGNQSRVKIEIKFIKERKPVETADISIGAIPSLGEGVVVNWSFKAGFSAPDGVKVLWNKSGNLKFPVEAALLPGYQSARFVVSEDKKCNDPIYGSKYISDTSKTSTTICLSDGDSYAFRVCRYNKQSGTCDIYSNEVRILAPGGVTY